EYKLYHCPKCDLQWWEPLKIVPEFYEQEGEEAYAIFHMGINQTIGENHKMFFKHMPLKSGRLLDVGCGDGVFLAEAQRRGYEVWGIDFDRKSIRVCQEKKGLKNTFAMTPQEFAEFCQKEGLRFDIITFFEVLEHQDKPKEFLEAVKSMLRPGGWIAGSVPNRESMWIRLYNKFNKNSDYPPNHLIRFNNYSLNFLLKQYFILREVYFCNPIMNSVFYEMLKLIKSKIYHDSSLIYRAEDNHSINADIKVSNIHLRKIFKTVVLKPALNLIGIIMAFIYGNDSTIYFQSKIGSEGAVK
ncbi:MAG: class I SAM-dependent methyltransferase, partial [Elusimicrobiota bacterium]|nr:methyltransferase domain-containing protein [Endomicrobiia bacterium]MDW8166590.1 class I SAM-dependent methyltransferase [Elusimicrobiota bacterium]